jgi:hypothetical protein
MPEHIRYVLHISASKLYCHDIRNRMDAKTTGKIRPPYEEL